MFLQDSNARCKITEKYKKRGQYESRTRKVIHISQVDFQQKLYLMLILQTIDQFPKYKQDVCKTIPFVSNVDVQAFITHFHNN